MDVRLPDGTILKNVPDGTTKAQLTEKLAANGYDIGMLGGAPAADTSARQNVAAETAPAWAKEYPRLYEAAVKTRQVVGPTVEMLGAVGGGVLGAGAGAVGGPVGVATGAVGGASLGYGISKEALEQADVALGLKAPRTKEQLVTEPIKNVLEGATFEAGGRVAGPIIQKGAQKVGEVVSKVAGKVADIRQIPKQKAANILRQSVAGDVDEVVNALRNAKPGQTPAEALAEAGLNEPTAQALLKRSAAKDPKFFTDLLKNQDTQTANTLAKIAGGETETASRGTLENMKNALNTMTGPQREAALNRANLGKAVAEYEAEAGQLSKAAGAEVQKVRDLISAGNSAEAWARLQMIKRNLPVGAAKYTYANELAEKAFGEWSDRAAQASLDLGQGAQFRDAAAQTLRNYGIKPIEGAPLVQNIQAIAQNPAFAGNDIIAASVRNVADDIAKWTNSGGVVDARALDAIRKNSVNAAIRQLQPTLDATSQKKLAAQVLNDIKPLIVDAIEGAGGTGYRQYLADYTKGMQRIGQTKLGSEAMKLYKQSPDQFVKLVEGNSPDVVEKIFGPGSYDVAVEMSNDAFKTLKSAATQQKVRQEIATQASAGETALVDLLKDNIISMKLPNVFSIVATTTNKALDILEKKLGKAVMAELTAAARDTKTFDELLKTLPASDRAVVLKTIKDPKTWESIGKGVEKALPTKARGGVAAGAVNALAPEEQNENALAR
jgi:hypothetical protein